MKIFEEFTNLYALSKTLRFELKPVGRTLENMKNHFEYDKEIQTFMKDQRIEDAYQVLKPIIDDIHEEFIDSSLTSKEAKNIDFSRYLKAFREKKDDKGEKNLRNEIGKLYFIGEQKLKGEYPNFKWKRGSGEAKGFNVLMSQDILEVIKDRYKDNEKVQSALIEFKGFFTYLSGFNQNRENYYNTNGKATAIATRIVDINLPKFCDNSLLFNSCIKKNKNNKKEEVEYLNIYQYLKNCNKTTQIKDAKSNKMIEAYPIKEKYFKISYFNFCLSQGQIEEYNKVIGHYNLLINLYNQVKSSEEKNLDKKDRTFKKLSQFKTLYKQIGCGEKDSLFFALKYDKEIDVKDEDRKGENKVLSVEKILEIVNQAGKKYFIARSEDDIVKTVPSFIDWLEENHDDWSGFYWSSKAINTISNRYFANWHSIIDLIHENHNEYDNVATYDKKREQQVKLRNVVELSGLFDLLDKSIEEYKENWWEDFFKKSVWGDEEKLKIIKEYNTPSKALMKLFYFDIKGNINEFNKRSKSIQELEDYKSDESKKKIKEWMDYGLTVNQMLKYFLVNENKCKGKSLNSELVEILNRFIKGVNGEVDWFKWYDALRNYLTKKVQDDAKENKLKLNFESPNLLGGWSDGQEKVKKSVILKHKQKLYLGILKKSSIFDTKKKENNIVYSTEITGAGRLILANLKFQTLAGKGFLSKFGISYGNMGKEDPQKAIEYLQEIMKERYISKYSLLERISKNVYKDKKEFDKDIQETLKECYVCEFEPVNWTEIEKQIEAGELYVFEISNKKSNLQNIYWNEVLNSNSPHQLNGGGEIFYRKQAIKNKKVKEGYENKSWVIENKRFTENEKLEKSVDALNTDGKSFFFHCPVKLNYKATGNPNPKFALSENNKKVNNSFTKINPYFLGLDRGEKHLVYYSLVDKDGNEVDEGSFNVINGQDYHKKLDEREGDRKEARKNWQTIGNIKNLKEGYISQVVHEIVKKIIGKPTFIVLEDLNTGFKRGRQKIEKQIYQKFELALAKKMNFIVDKNKEKDEIGSVTKAIQLTPPVQNYQDIESKKQVGIMLYTRANYTSQTDPLTGWRKTIYLKRGSEEFIREQVRKKFTDIVFENGDYFFSYTDKQGKPWKLWSGKNGKSLLRYSGKRGEDKNEWIVESFDLNEMLNDIFERFDKNRSLYLQIFDKKKEISKINEKNTAWESFRFVIDLIQQIRNSGDVNKGHDDNFLLSPVRDEQTGEHFDSRKQMERLPRDADANGAYNIARKGIIMNEHIKQWGKDGSKKNKQGSDLDLFISDEEWDLWLNHRDNWKDKLSIFSSRENMKKYRKQKRSR